LYRSPDEDATGNRGSQPELSARRDGTRKSWESHQRRVCEKPAQIPKVHLV